MNASEKPRKVLHFSTYDAGGGAALAAYDLHGGLLSVGVDSRLAVQIKSRCNPEILSDSEFLSGLHGRLRGYLDFARFALYRNRKRQICFSTNAQASSSWEEKVRVIDPDVVHLHWIGSGFLQIESISRFGKPVVWTMHDSWPFTGGCHVPGTCLRYRENCGACPALGSSGLDDLSQKTWRRKEKAWRSVDLTLVAPSRWLADCARQSTLLRDRRVEVIPNGLDLQIFSPRNREEARSRLGLPLSTALIGFGAVLATGDPNKGFDLLTEALNRMPTGQTRDLALVMYGQAEPRIRKQVPMRLFSMGPIPREQLPWFYSAIDVLAVPSRQENLPFSAMESLACGTPCVAFDTSGLRDLVEHERNGYLARPYDTEDLACGLNWVLEDAGRRKALSDRARRKCEEEFSTALQIRRYLQLYGEVLRA